MKIIIFGESYGDTCVNKQTKQTFLKNCSSSFIFRFQKWMYEVMESGVV